MSGRKYNLENVLDMIDLAHHVQIKVYWGSSFYIGDNDELISYKEFWDILEDKVLSESCKVVEIFDGYTVEIRFLDKLEDDRNEE